MLRAVLVLGPECSGTRLVTRILMEAGCAGDDGHVQRWDSEAFEGDLVVWRRSFPHDGEWPDVAALAGRLWQTGHLVQAVVPVREQFSLALSQVRNGYAPSAAAAQGRINEGFCRIFSELEALGVPYVVLTYEGLVQRPRNVQRWLAEMLGLPETPQVPVWDMNAKYYKRCGGC